MRGGFERKVGFQAEEGGEDREGEEGQEEREGRGCGGEARGCDHGSVAKDMLRRKLAV